MLFEGLRVLFMSLEPVNKIGINRQIANERVIVCEAEELLLVG